VKNTRQEIYNATFTASERKKVTGQEKRSYGRRIGLTLRELFYIPVASFFPWAVNPSFIPL
jgi:hypothetical protein